VRSTPPISLSRVFSLLCLLGIGGVAWAQQGGTTPTLNAASPAAKPAGDVLPARGAYHITGDANAISVFAVSVDAQELFTAIATKANLPVIVDGVVSRRITVNVTKRTARQTVTDICSAYGLSVADVEGVTMISDGIPNSPSSYLLSDISMIPTKYVIAAAARNLLPVFLQDYVKINAEQNAVVLSAPTEVLAKFKEDIAQFDIPASQIVVELLLVELTKASLDQFSFPISYLNAGQGPAIDPSNGTITYNGFSATSNQFKASLTALVQKGQAKVRANPRIATVSGRPASIFVGLQKYVVTPIDTPQGQKNNIDAGVRLNITPYTGGKGQVLVDVTAEVSTLSAPDPITKLPEKSTRTAATTVRVDDGKTIVIGGLTQQESRSVRNKVPVFGDIPLLGPLFFQSHNIQTTETELVLFVTPRILSNTGHLPATEEDALKGRFLNSDLAKPIPPAAPAPTPPIPPSLTLPKGELDKEAPSPR
jgi:type II secretory pathway component GspD/PulD (secretin)